MNASNRNNGIDFLRGIAILGVVIIHSYFPGKMSESTLSIIGDLQNVFSWVVLAFFYSSGYFSSWKINRIQLKKLSRKLLITCLFFSFLYLAIKLFIFGLGGFSSVTVMEILKNSLPMAPQFYFLVYLFVVMVLSSAFNVWIVVVLSCVTISTINTPDYYFGPEMELIPYYFLSYSFGYISRGKGVWYIFLITFFMVVINQELTHLFLLVPFFVMYIGDNVSGRLAGYINYLGERSLAIYVLHTPILLPAIMRGMSALSNYSLINVIVSIGLTVIISIVIFDVIGRLQNKYEKNKSTV
ncbi:acyltransferase family protein [Vibrio mediterranei]|uniref:acyltransferase family protein n=1 Tax=Vibrio mediterranei TaxID=689 RepID=UPI004067A663